MRCRYIKHSGLDILTPIHERKIAFDCLYNVSTAPRRSDEMFFSCECVCVCTFVVFADDVFNSPKTIASSPYSYAHRRSLRLSPA